MKKYIIFIVILIFMGCATKSQYSNVVANPYQILFTTGLDANSDPIDSVKEISLNEPRVYIYVKWRLPIAKRVHFSKVFDGEGNLVYQSEYRFEPSTVNWFTWTWHNINKNTDKAGLWKFQIFADGKLLVEKQIKVVGLALPNS